MSAPASAYVRAAAARSGKVASLSIAPSEATTPQCPCVVYSQRQTSAMRASPGAASRSARRAIGTGPRGSAAFSPRSSFSKGRPKRRSPPIPAALARSATRGRSLTGSRACPGSDAISVGAVAFASTNTGSTNIEGSSLVSATRSATRARRRSRDRLNWLGALTSVDMDLLLVSRRRDDRRHEAEDVRRARHRGRPSGELRDPSRRRRPDGDEPCT